MHFCSTKSFGRLGARTCCDAFSLRQKEWILAVILDSSQQAVWLSERQLSGRGEKCAKQGGLGEHGELYKLLFDFLRWV